MATPTLSLTINITDSSGIVSLPIITPPPLNTVTVNWGDGNTDNTVTHYYSTGGPYTIEVSLNNGYNATFGNDGVPWPGASYVTSVNSWYNDSSGGFTSFSGAFNGATALTTVPITLPTGVTDLSYMFANASSFNQPLNNWTVSSVTNMSFMFANASSFNEDLINWDVSSVTNMQGMFSGAISFNQSLAAWIVSNVTNMQGMLDGTLLSISNYNSTLNDWALLSVQNSVNLGASGLYYDASGAVGRNILTNTYNWNITGDIELLTLISLHINITDSSGTVSLPVIPVGTIYNPSVNWGDGTPVSPFTGFTHNYVIGGLYTISVYDTSGSNILFGSGGAPWPGASYVTSVTSWSDQITSLSGAFNGATALTTVPITLPTGVTDLSYMFANASSFNQSLAAWNVSSVTNMSAMFINTSSFNQSLAAWTVSSVTNMQGMFFGAIFNQPLNNWNVSNVTDMAEMFAENMVFNQPLNNWTVSSVTNMQGMFTNAQLFNQPLNNWTVSSVTNMSYMFQLTPFNESLASWNVSSVTNMQGMFNASSFNQPLNNWNVSSVTNMQGMFSGATSFNQSLAAWNVSNVTNMQGMLDDTLLSISNYNSTLNDWALLSVQSSVPLGAVGLQYDSSGEAGRNILTNTYNWTITGDSILCFAKGTLILCDLGAIRVEELVVGMNVVTYKHGNLKIKKIIKGTMQNDPNIPLKCMFRHLEKDFVVTGGHGILVDDLPRKVDREQKKMYGFDQTIDDKKLLLACLAPGFEKIETTELFQWYHFILENDSDIDARFGVWANGVLCDTPSERFIEQN